MKTFIPKLAFHKIKPVETEKNLICPKIAPPSYGAFAASSPQKEIPLPSVKKNSIQSLIGTMNEEIFDHIVKYLIGDVLFKEKYSQFPKEKRTQNYIDVKVSLPALKHVASLARISKAFHSLLDKALYYNIAKSYAISSLHFEKFLPDKNSLIGSFLISLNKGGGEEIAFNMLFNMIHNYAAVREKKGIQLIYSPQLEEISSFTGYQKQEIINNIFIKYKRILTNYERIEKDSINFLSFVSLQKNLSQKSRARKIILGLLLIFLGTGAIGVFLFLVAPSDAKKRNFVVDAIKYLSICMIIAGGVFATINAGLLSKEFFHSLKNPRKKLHASDEMTCFKQHIIEYIMDTEKVKHTDRNLCRNTLMIFIEKNFPTTSSNAIISQALIKKIYTGSRLMCSFLKELPKKEKQGV